MTDNGRRKHDPVSAIGREQHFFPADPETAATLNPVQIETYNRDGYLSPLDVFSPNEAARNRAYIDNLIAQVLNADDPRNAYSINNYHLVCAGLWDLITDARIQALVTDILGPQAICWGCHLFAKLPGDPKIVPFHQDAIYWPLTPSRTTSVWLAIDDTDAGNAAMQFVPGSHLLGPLAHETKGLDGTRVLGSEVRDSETYSDRHVNTLRAGQISIHSDLLLHGSEANQSERRRAGLTMRFAAADVRLIEGYDMWRKSAVHIGAGDPDNFWYNRRRPEGERPELMADFWGEFDGQPLRTE